MELIHTTLELDELPVGSVIRDEDGDIGHKSRNGADGMDWHTIEVSRTWGEIDLESSSWFEFPCLLLFRGGGEL